MKILIISTLKGVAWGGSEELWYKLAIHAVDSGCEVTVLVIKNRSTHIKIENLRKKGCNICYTNDRKLIGPSRLQRLILKFKKKDYQLQFSNRFEKAFDTSADIVVISQAGVLDITYYEDLLHSLKKNSLPYVVINQHHYEFGMLTECQRASLLNFFHEAKNVFFVSNRNKEVLERQLLTRFPNSNVIKNPVNCTSPKVVSWPISSIPRLAVVARMDIDFKGQDILLEMLATDKWNDREFIVEFYGEGPHKQYLTDLIRFYNLEKKVFLMGHSNDISQVWERNHLLVLPSHSEGTPLSLVEAMLCGRPCVVTDVGDCGCVIKNNDTGWLAYTCSVNSLDEAMERAWQQQTKWEKMGRSANSDILKFIDNNPGKTVFQYLSSK